MKNRRIKKNRIDFRAVLTPRNTEYKTGVSFICTAHFALFLFLYIDGAAFSLFILFFGFVSIRPFARKRIVFALLSC